MVKLKIIITICVVTITNSAALAQLPDHFDWRNVNGENWMTPVKNQAQCGSCWGFSAVGAVDAQYNIFFDWADYDIDLSEEHLVSDCFDSWDCAGGWHDDALAFIRDSGITDEACFPYVDSDCPMWCGCDHGCSNAECDDRCAQWSVRLWEIDGMEHVLNTVAAIKNYIYDVGPLSVCMDWSHGDFDEDEIWRCNPDAWYHHCVVLVGWDETDDYWIAKNSWGAAWPPHDPGGYFKVGFGECLVQNLAYGATLANPDIDKFHVENSSGETVAWFGDLGNIVLKGTLTSGGTCVAPSGSFIMKDSSGDTVAYIDNQGNMCIEGTWSEEESSCNPTASVFTIKDSTGAKVSYIDSDGKLCLTGKLYQNPEP